MLKSKWFVIKRFVKRFFINVFLLLNGRIVHIFLLYYFCLQAPKENQYEGDENGNV